MHVFTSITANYLPKARVLANSVKKFHPDARFHLILSDAIPETLRRNQQPFDSVITVEELPIPNVKSWIFKHRLVELCTGVKGFAFQEIFKRHNAETILYLDPDIVVMSRLDALLARLQQNSVLLTPHQIEPEQSAGAIIDNEICSLKHGVYNLGFVMVRMSPEGRRFVDWWAQRLQHFCYDDIPNGLFTDQRWVDLAPALFPDIGILREPEYNVATWNLTTRRATGSISEGILINGRPLCFYHFSGFDSGAQEIMLKKYGATSPVLFELREWYIAECERYGQKDEGSIPCIYNTFDNEQTIQDSHRLLYRQREDLQKAFPNPFEATHVNQSYYHWHFANAQTSPAAEANKKTVAELQRQVQDLRDELSLIRKNWLRWRITRSYLKLSKHFKKPAPVTLNAVPHEVR